MDLPTSLLRRDGERYLPTVRANGPWGPGTMSGLAVSGLIGYVAEQALGTDGFTGTRLTVDLSRMATLDELTTECEVLREGRRLRLADVAVTQNGRQVAQGRVVFVRPSPTPVGKVWSDPVTLPPPPADDPTWLDGPRAFSDEGGGGIFDFDLWRDPTLRKLLWFRAGYDLIEGEPMSGFVRAACVADAANPLTNWGSEGLEFVNSDVSMMLVRPPVGEFIGLVARDRQVDNGVSVGSATMHDQQGPVGTCVVTSLASEVPMQLPRRPD